MTKLDRPSHNEDDYFAARDLELRQAMHERLLAERKAAERRLHYMKCPKCGADLGPEIYDGVQVDRCPECHGVWLDPGDLELLHRREDKNVLARVVADVQRALREKKAK
jgi:Zn-finger nucleic acid-binding protein